ncbi:MAG: ABC transporter ATP-binding protein [Acidobacteriota bacterium]|nr:MAG: ABC transporter ATP-binding protein [Acidobacteriota bacterium]
MSEVLVEIRQLGKVFKRDSVEIRALDGIDLDLHSGEFVSLMGPSGSGKSTLLNIIAGIDRQTEGTARVLGTDLSQLNEDQLAGWRNDHVGFVFQHFNLIPVLTAFENVELPLLLTSLSRQERREHVMTALKVVGLSDRVKHYPRQLSGGQEQRVSIARAIVTDPTFILADEPTGDLDAVSAEEVLEVLKSLNRDFGKTIVMVTHDPRAARYAATNYYLDKGLLVEHPDPNPALH